MGAIAAIIGNSGDPELLKRLQNMLVRSRYRGEPEHVIEDGVLIGIQSADGDASLARDESLTVAFHGFIGNWNDLNVAHRLHIDRAFNDAGRLAIAFQVLGAEIFEKLRGEFSALIVDRRSDQALIVRDLTSQRPIYYGYDNKANVVIATEARQVLAGSENPADLDELNLALHAAGKLLPDERTLYRHVHRFIPGSIHRVRTHPVGRVGPPTKYWNPSEASDSYSTNPEELTERLRFLLAQAVHRTIPQGEGRFGLSLSGGLDSSSIWGLIHHDLADDGLDPYRCVPYCMVFPGMPFDESGYIQTNLDSVGRAGRLLDLAGLPISAGSERVPTIPNNPLRAGTLHLNAIQTALKGDRLSVLLTGNGGDEWFRGNLSYIPRLAATGNGFLAAMDLVNYFRANRRKTILWREGFRPRIIQTIRRSNRRRFRLSADMVHPRLRTDFLNLLETTEESNRRRREKHPNQPVVSILQILQNGNHDDPSEQLASIDGVSRRCPLMDRDLIDFSLTTSPRWMIKAGETKYLLRRAVNGATPSTINRRLEKTVFDASHIEESFHIAQHEPATQWQLTNREILNKLYIDKTIQKAENGEQAKGLRLTELFDLEFFMRRVL